jgi:hypothetical protein
MIHILELFRRTFRSYFILFESFWPNWRVNYEHASIPIVVDVDPQDLIILPYCGFRSMCPSLRTTAYTPFRDLFVSNYVVQHVDHTIYLVWMGSVESGLYGIKKMRIIGRSMFNGGAKNDEELYHNYSLSKWKSNHVDPKQWIKICYVMFFSWL